MNAINKATAVVAVVAAIFYGQELALLLLGTPPWPITGSVLLTATIGSIFVARYFWTLP